MRKSLWNIAIVSGILAIAACSPEQQKAPKEQEKVLEHEKTELSKLHQLAITAGEANGEFRQLMLAYDDKMSDEDRAVWEKKTSKQGGMYYFEDFYTHGKEHIGDPEGLDALLMAMEVALGGRIDVKKISNIHELLYTNYLNEPAYINILKYVRRGWVTGDPRANTREEWLNSAPKRHKRAVSLFERAIKNTTNPVVKNNAMLVYSDYLLSSLDGMGPDDADERNKRRNYAEEMLTQVVANSKASKMPRLMTRDIKILFRYQVARRSYGQKDTKEESKENTKEEKSAKAEQKPAKAFTPPLLHDTAEEMLYRLNNLTVGKRLPKTIGVDLQGKPQNIDQYKGRVLLIDFWATWCGPCIAKMPHLRRLEKEYAGRPFEILGVNADDAVETAREYIEENELPWDHWFATMRTGLTKEWGVRALPTVYLIDHTGMVVLKDPEEKEIEDMMETLIAAAEKAAAKK